MKNSAVNIQGRIFQIFCSHFGQCHDFILSFRKLLTFNSHLNFSQSESSYNLWSSFPDTGKVANQWWIICNLDTYLSNYIKIKEQKISYTIFEHVFEHDAHCRIISEFPSILHDVWYKIRSQFWDLGSKDHIFSTTVLHLWFYHNLQSYDWENPIEICALKIFTYENYRDWELRGPCRENLHYLWKRAVRITNKP